MVKEKLGENEYKIAKEMYESGLPVIGEESFIGTVQGDVLNINGEEHFLLKNHALRYFYRSKEYPVVSVEDNWIK